MNLDISSNKLAEIRKILKERRREKSGKKLESQPPQNNPVEEIANIVPSFSSTIPLNKYPVSQESKSSLELKKRSVSEPPPNFKPLRIENAQKLTPSLINSADVVGVFREPEVKNQQDVLENRPPKQPVLLEEEEIQEPKQQDKREVKIPPPPSKQRSSKRFFIF